MSGLGEQPDYQRQVDASGPARSSSQNRGQSRQGDPTGTIQTDDLEREGRRRIPREASGATGARSSSSISRDRSNLRLRDTTGSSASASGDARNASMSPNRAMGTRSVSIDRTQGPIYTRQNTLEGIGASGSPIVSFDALESRGRTTRLDDIVRSVSQERGRLPAGGSPTGARSVSSSRKEPSVPEELPSELAQQERDQEQYQKTNNAKPE